MNPASLRPRCAGYGSSTAGIWACKAVEVELQLTVENLLARYVHALDDDRLEDWRGFFSAKGRYRITNAENYESGRRLLFISAVSRAMVDGRVSTVRSA